MTIYGYCRVSTAHQSIDRQVVDILRVYPQAEIIRESYTGTKVVGRPQLDRLLDKVQPGDMIVFESVDRMSRNADEGIDLYMDLYARGVDLVFLTQPMIDTSVYRSAMNASVPMTGTAADSILTGVNAFLHELASQQIRAAFDQAQAQVDRIHRRTSEGMRAAGASNVVGPDGHVVQRGSISTALTGRKVTTAKSVQAKSIILKHSKTFGGSLSDGECIELAHVSRNAYYKYKRELLTDE